MPYKFKFLINNILHFSCNLQCVRCTAQTTNGRRCKLTTCIGTPYCWNHLLSLKKLRVKPSTNPRAGRGLFAQSRHLGEDDIVFRNGDVIIEYDGEIVNDNTLDDRYGDYTAPYALKQGDHIEDGACQRGTGTLINHAPRSRANSRFSFSRNSRRFRIVATKNIRNNREIFCYYGTEYRFNESTSHSTK